MKQLVLFAFLIFFLSCSRSDERLNEYYFPTTNTLITDKVSKPNFIEATLQIATAPIIKKLLANPTVSTPLQIAFRLITHDG